MVEIKLSIMRQNAGHVGEFLRALNQFSRAQKIQVHLTALEWDTAWTEISGMGIHGQGADISEVGTTWMVDLVRLNALRSLEGALAERILKAGAYYPALLRTCQLAGAETLWGMPWLSGVRAIYYRRDLLKKAGIEEAEIFNTAAALDAGLETLYRKGYAPAWLVPTVPTTNTLHYGASWVWQAGGRFISMDDAHATFADPEALDGLAAYFALGRFMGMQGRQMTEERAVELFWTGLAPVTVDGSWALQIRRSAAAQVVFDNLGVAPVLGTSFVGGSNLVVWKHTREPEACEALLRFLASPEILQMQYRQTGLLPAEAGATVQLGLRDSQVFNAFQRMLGSGRSWPTVPFAGVVENRLRDALAEVWEDVLDHPGSDPRPFVAARLEPLQARINASLNQ